MGLLLERIRQHFPLFSGIQVMTRDGLSLADWAVAKDADRLAALTALLYNGAKQLGDCLTGEAGGLRGMTVTLEHTHCIVLPYREEFTVAVCLPVTSNPAYSLQSLHDFISAVRDDGIHSLAA